MAENHDSTNTLLHRTRKIYRLYGRPVFFGLDRHFRDALYALDSEERLMLARDFMTPDPVSVSPETPVREIARRLLSRNVSALPVLNADHEVIGMVSEGDLIRGANLGSPETNTGAARKDWWLSILAEGEPVATAFLQSISHERTAEQVMSSPVITVTGGADLGEVARLLNDYHFKRVPVIEGRKLAGIISRADLLRAFITTNPSRPAPSGGFDGLLSEAAAALGKYLPHESDAPSPAPVCAPVPTTPAAKDFRGLMADFEQQKILDRLAAKRAAIEARKVKIKDMIDTHVTDKIWSEIMNGAAAAASQGLKEHLLLRFPNDVCTDGGRSIDQGEDEWPSTLSGEPAEIYLRWKNELEPKGFRLKAHTIEYVDGFPGDIGLFLNWAIE